MKPQTREFFHDRFVTKLFEIWLSKIYTFYLRYAN